MLGPILNNASTLTASRLREVLSYDKETGVFIWRIQRKGAQPGSVAGCVRPDGYISICIDYRSYLAHRLAWLYVNGRFPEGHLDHRNGIRSDNTILNLRKATSRQNNVNRKSRGYYWDSSRAKLMAMMSINNRTINLGRFSNENDAKNAYISAVIRNHGKEWAERK